MTDQKYVQELSRLAELYEAGRIDPATWREQLAALRDKRREARPSPK